MPIDETQAFILNKQVLRNQMGLVSENIHLPTHPSEQFDQMPLIIIFVIVYTAISANQSVPQNDNRRRFARSSDSDSSSSFQQQCSNDCQDEPTLGVCCP